MNIVVLMDHRFLKTPDGRVWSYLFGSTVWERYLEVFDRVKVVARVQPIDEVAACLKCADHPAVEFVHLPCYRGILQYLKHANRIRAIVKNIMEPYDAMITRGGQASIFLEKAMHRIGKPYAAEVIGDPYDLFAPGAFRHPLRPILRMWMPRTLRIRCKRAAAVLYVTERALQQRYPCPSYSVGVSDVVLPPESFCAGPRAITVSDDARTLITVGSLEHPYKCPDVLLEAFYRCIRSGLNLRLVYVGDGKMRQKLEARSKGLGIENLVVFKGMLPAGAAVRRELDSADIFVLPSKQEGLPRAMVEAMARALPCIGSRVGGIPELLEEEDMVTAGNAAELANKIGDVVSNPSRMTQMSHRNLKKAQEYREDILRERRIAFYKHIRKETEAWQTKHGIIEAGVSHTSEVRL